MLFIECVYKIDEKFMLIHCLGKININFIWLLQWIYHEIPYTPYGSYTFFMQQATCKNSKTSSISISRLYLFIFLFFFIAVSILLYYFFLSLLPFINCIRVFILHILYRIENTKIQHLLFSILSLKAYLKIRNFNDDNWFKDNNCKKLLSENISFKLK